MDRVISRPEELQELIRDEAAKYAECKDCYFGGVYWHEPDESECNWNMASIRGQDWSGCLDRMLAFVTRLRERYNVPNPQQGVTYKGCQIAIEAIPERREGKNEFVASWVIMQAGQLRKFGSALERFENSGQTLLAGEALAQQDVDALFTEGYLR
jgi:hypothetical protein